MNIDVYIYTCLYTVEHRRIPQFSHFSCIVDAFNINILSERSEKCSPTNFRSLVLYFLQGLCHEMNIFVKAHKIKPVLFV
jgi:hypothetical protein